MGPNASDIVHLALVSRYHVCVCMPALSGQAMLHKVLEQEPMTTKNAHANLV
jgi:hypothetical protein